MARFLSVDQVFQTQVHLCETYGMNRGVRSQAILRQAALRPFDMAQTAQIHHEDLPLIAAHYAVSLVQLQPFAEGNVVTAFAVAHQFLFMNDVLLNVQEQQFVDKMMLLVGGELTVEQLANYFADYSDPLPVQL
ncbi:MAG TPA: Fic family protein [Oculatellaceae cyanobacterium]